MHTCFSSKARVIMSFVEFQRVDTSGINSSGLTLTAIHCCLNFSLRCGDPLTLMTILRSFKFNKPVN